MGTGSSEEVWFGLNQSLDLLIQSLQNIQIDADRQDEVEWELEKSKIFTTKILYKFLMHGGAQVKDAENISKTSLPMKIKVFLWQLSLNKLQSAVTLKRRGWKGSTRCVLCGRQESVSHIFLFLLFRLFCLGLSFWGVWRGDTQLLGWVARGQAHEHV